MLFYGYELPPPVNIYLEQSDPTELELVEFLVKYKYISLEKALELASNITGLKCSEIPYGVQLLHAKENKYYIDEVTGVYVFCVPASKQMISEMELSLEVDPSVSVSFIYTLETELARVEGKLSSTYGGTHLYLRYVYEAICRSSSDLHIEVRHKNYKPIFRVFARRGNFRQEIKLFDLDLDMNKSMVADLINVLSNNNQASYDLSIIGEITCEVTDVFKDGDVELRAEIMTLKTGYKITTRIQQRRTSNFAMEDLGFSSDIIAAIRKGAKKKAGLDLFTGAPRTGKNTSMNALANELARDPREFAIEALDHPIEFLGDYAQADYKNSIKHLMALIRATKRQDLDYILINEINDAQVAHAVLNLVNAASHVITTLHQDRVYHIPYKLEEFFGDSYKNLISRINFVCNQRLFDKCCEYCSRDVHRSKVEIENRVLYDKLMQMGIVTYRESIGCKRCNHTGIDESTVCVIPEVILFDEELSDKLKRCKELYQMEDILKERVAETSLSLEYGMTQAIKKGMIKAETLETI